MHAQPGGSPTAGAAEESHVANLYQQLLESWNRRDAAAYAALFDEDCSVVGFDGSAMNGRAEIETSLGEIFASHMTATYVAKVRDVRFLTAEVAVLRAVAGMVPPGGADINSAVNAVQTLVAVRREDGWRVALFQNTPAQFHGRPEMSESLTAELRELL